MANVSFIVQIRLHRPQETVMLNLEPADLESIHRSAVESAELLRRSGERAKAARLESLARIVAQELARRRDPAAGPAPEMVQAGPRATTTFG